MPTEVFEDTLDWECGTLEMVPTVSDLPPYPYPALRPTGRSQPTSLRVAILENDLVQATFARDLGGRLLQLLDKRTGRRSLAIPTVLAPHAEGPRGAWLSAGLQWMTSGPNRPNAMGPVDFRPEPSDEDDEPGGLIFFELESGTDLSLAVRWRLAPDRAVLQADVRIHNRGLVPAPYAGGFCLATGAAIVVPQANGVAIVDAVADAGYAVLAPVGVFATMAQNQGDRAWFRRPEGPAGWLAPLEADAFSVVVVPFSGIGSPDAVTDTGAVSRAEDRLRVQLHRPMEGGRMFLLTAGDQTMEAPAPADPVTPLTIPLVGDLAGPKGFALRDAEGVDRLSWPVAATELPSPDPLFTPPPSSRAEVWAVALARLARGEDPSAALAQAEADPALRGPARLVAALAHLQCGDAEAAMTALDDALLRLGDDPMVWWLHAVATRRAGLLEDGAERADLLNAHFLSPLEPALRAEGFLAQSPLQGREPNALVRPLAGHPEALSDVACRLLAAGLRDDAARWLDEALRHGEAPLLRYLTAASLVEGSRMRAEAALHVAAAAQCEWGPPFPWRVAERHAVRVLHAAFPHDLRLQRLAELIGPED